MLAFLEQVPYVPGVIHFILFLLGMGEGSLGRGGAYIVYIAASLNENTQNKA